MNTATHVQITTEALRDRFQPGSLPLIIRANLAQDRLTKLVGHPEIHFDGSAFAASERYVEQQRQKAVQAISRRDRRVALHAFGRLLHGRQDFYATPTGPRGGSNSRAGSRAAGRRISTCAPIREPCSA